MPSRPRLADPQSLWPSLTPTFMIILQGTRDGHATFLNHLRTGVGILVVFSLASLAHKPTEDLYVHRSQLITDPLRNLQLTFLPAITRGPDVPARSRRDPIRRNPLNVHWSPTRHTLLVSPHRLRSTSSSRGSTGGCRTPAPVHQRTTCFHTTASCPTDLASPPSR
jgi:hypothetical protein